MSSSLHGLSHQLHPSKLEQLGLEAVLRSLCKEFGQAHGLPVNLSCRELPDGIRGVRQGVSRGFADSLTESSILEALNEHDTQFRDRLFNPVTTIWGFLSQVP